MEDNKVTIISTHSGTLSDNADFNEKLIQNQTDFENFTGVIATSLLTVISKTNVKSQANNQDDFLNNKVSVDFSTQDIIVTRGYKVESLTVDNGVYVATLNRNGMGRETSYFASIVKAPVDRPSTLSISNDSEDDRNSAFICEQRPMNYNSRPQQAPKKLNQKK